MRSLIAVVCVALIVSLFAVSSVEAKGRGGGGGGNRGGGGGGRGGQQGGSKHSGQQQARGGGNKQTQPGGTATTDKHTDKVASKPDKKTTTGDAGKTTDGTETANKKQKQLEIAQRQRDKRLAQADHLRTIAERNGNQNLADAADRMETHAEELYQQRVDHLSKFGVTDPALDPGGVTDPGGLTDPGIIDSVGDLSGPELFPAIP